MAPSFFGSGTRETSSVKYFEIRYAVTGGWTHEAYADYKIVRLDDSIIILRGTEDEASSALLKGTLVLCLSEPLRINGIRLRFTGQKKLG